MAGLFSFHRTGGFTVAIRISVEDHDLYGLVVTDFKGLRKGSEWVRNEVQSHLCYRADGTLTVR
jgi:hypothetical protein